MKEIKELKSLQRLESSMRNCLEFDDDPTVWVFDWQLTGIIVVGLFILWFIFGG